ncbi:unnamed protein product, partial [Oppiella nova]
VLAFILPPAAVLLDRGCNLDFLLNILLTVFGWLPGFIHALFIICRGSHDQQHIHHIHTTRHIIVATEPQIMANQQPSVVYAVAPPPPYNPQYPPSAPPYVP